jgi:hypothetical protein
MSEEIKPCPLCGDDAHLASVNLIQCNNWDCALGHVQITVDKWNHRPQVESLTRQLDEARKREAAMRQYFAARRRAIESTIANERLAGREDRIPQEQHALAEITAMVCAFTFIPREAANQDECDPTIPPPVHKVIATMEYVPKEIADTMADALEEILTQDWIKTSAVARAGKDALETYRNATKQEETK